MDYFYTAQEAIARLKMPRSTFYRLVQEGQITPFPVPARKQAYYEREMIDHLADERARRLRQYREGSRHVQFCRPSEADFVRLRTPAFNTSFANPLGRASVVWQFGDELTKTNPDVFHILKDARTGAIYGGVMMSPIAESAWSKLLVYDGTYVDCYRWHYSLNAEDYLPYSPSSNDPVDIFVFDMFTAISPLDRHYGALILRHALRFLEEQLERGVVIGSLYCAPEHADQLGHRFVKRVGFRPARTDPWGRRLPPTVREQLLTLRVFGGRSGSGLVQRYQARQHARQRRIRRNARQPSHVVVGLLEQIKADEAG